MYKKGYNELRILEPYTKDYGARHYLRELAKLTGISLKSVQNALAGLEQGNILKATVHGKHKYFMLNRENPQSKLYLVQAEIAKTNAFLETYPFFKTFLKHAPSSITFIVFGSFASFTAKKHSDIDMIVIHKPGETATLPFHLLPDKVHQVVLLEHAFQKAVVQGDSLLREVEKNHVILTNHSYYTNIVWDTYGKTKQ